MSKTTQESGKLKRSTVLSYALAAGTGSQFIGALVGTYISVFLTDTFGVPAAAVGIIMVIATIWDAINDPMMGSIADHTKSRWGRYRPYLLFIPIPLAIVTVLLFSNPDLSTTGKIAWTAVFYIAYGMLTTAIQIPFGAIINAVTDQESQRRRMVSSYTFVMGIVTTIASSFALVLIEIAGKGNTAKGYMIVLGIAGIILVLTNWFCFACTKEKFVNKEQPEPLLKQLKKLVKFKEIFPVLLIWCMGCLGFQSMMGSSVYYITYYVGNPNLIPTYMLVVSLVGLLGIVIMLPIFSKIFKEMKTGFMVSQGIAAVCFFILFFIGKNSIPLLYILSGIAAIFITMSNAYIPLIMTEMIDYVYFKAGDQLNATIGALRGFSYKCGVALSSGIMMFTLGATGYVANAPEQTASALMGINFVRFLVPVISAIIVIICLKFYPVTGKVKEEMKDLYINQR